MRPLLEPGDRLLVIATRRPRAGQVVAVADPRPPRRLIVKRVEAVVGDGKLWLAGEDPDASTDSRVFGAVDESLVLGRAVWRYWPAQRRGPVGRDH